MGIKRLVIMSIGVWTPDSVQKFDIIHRAELYDNDPDDSDNMVIQR